MKITSYNQHCSAPFSEPRSFAQPSLLGARSRRLHPISQSAEGTPLRGRDRGLLLWLGGHGKRIVLPFTTPAAHQLHIVVVMSNCEGAHRRARFGFNYLQESERFNP